eukprot:365664-Chlamydomonas_euryale.AAC.23
MSAVRVTTASSDTAHSDESASPRKPNEESDCENRMRESARERNKIRRARGVWASRGSGFFLAVAGMRMWIGKGRGRRQVGISGREIRKPVGNHSPLGGSAPFKDPLAPFTHASMHQQV